jgi:UvrD-like helicase C-terminal domain
MSFADILPPISEDQQLISNALKNGYSVQCRAFAGSGKTTMALHFLAANPQARAIFLTYNRALIQSTIGKLEKMDEIQPGLLSRVFPATFHSLLGSLCSSSVESDIVFLEKLQSCDWKEKKQKWKFADFTHLIIDESQDMRKSYFTLAKCLVHKLCQKIDNLQILVLGHGKQVLYDFYPINRADARYLYLFDKLIQDKNDTTSSFRFKKWQQMTLSVSFRLTIPMVTVLNGMIEKEEHMKSFESLASTSASPPVTWIIADLYKDAAKIILPIAEKERGNLLVLCKSLNRRSPAIHIVDVLVEHNLLVHVSRSGPLAENSDDGLGTSSHSRSTTKNKICFKTFHSAKGLESPVVVVLLSSNVFPDYLSGKIRMTNAEYVALTRGSRELYVIQDFRKVTQFELNQFLKKSPSIQQQHLRIIVLRELKICPAPPQKQQQKEEEEGGEVPASFYVDTLFSFMDVSHIQQLLSLLEVRTIQQPLKSFTPLLTKKKIPAEMMMDEECLKLRSSMLETYFSHMNISFDKGDTYVNVRTILGLALTMALEYSVKNGSVPQLVTHVLSKCEGKNDDKHTYFQKQIHTCLETLLQEDRREEERKQKRSKKAESKKGESKKKEEGVEDSAIIYPKLKLFARLATFVDAFSSYGEKLLVVQNYDFIDQPGIFERFDALRSALEFILYVHSLEIKDLVWYREETGKFTYDNKSISIIAQPTIRSEDGSVHIHVFHSPEISHEDQLMTVTAAQISGDYKSHIYVINIGDGSIQYAKLKSKPHQTESSDVFLDVDKLTIKEGQEFLKEKSIEEDVSLHLIERAITFKLLKEGVVSDTEFILAHQ